MSSDTDITRRDFVRTAVGAVVGAAAMAGGPRQARVPAARGCCASWYSLISSMTSWMTLKTRYIVALSRCLVMPSGMVCMGSGKSCICDVIHKMH